MANPAGSFIWYELMTPDPAGSKRFYDAVVAGWTIEDTCCMDRLGTALSPLYGFRLSSADGLRASKLKHAVQGMNGNGNFGRATPIRP